ncbi:MAG: J domain-containing protein [Bdellovibrionota bacterium]
MQAKSFIEVLEEQIRNDLRKDIRSEVEAEVRAEFGRKENPARATGPVDMAGRLESLLATRVGKSIFSKAGLGKQAYASKMKTKPSTQEPVQKTTTAAPLSKEPRFTAKTVEQLCAIEMIKRHSVLSLGSTFTVKELKSAWRKAAMATHPDRFASSDEITKMRATVAFRELAEAYELLIVELAIETPQAAA